jgi:hypothetical protein
VRIEPIAVWQYGDWSDLFPAARVPAQSVAAVFVIAFLIHAARIDMQRSQAFPRL